MDIYKRTENIIDFNDFTEFLAMFKRDYYENPGDWENNDLGNFLEGFEGYISNCKHDKLSWKLLAEFLLAARVYE